MRFYRTGFQLLVGSLMGVASMPASAQTPVNCTTLPNPVYMPGTTLINPLLTKVAPFLATSSAGADRQTIIYRGISSCQAQDFVFNNTDLSGTFTYWTGRTLPDGKPETATCDMPAGVKATFAATDVGARACTGADTPSGIGEFLTYLEGLLFIVPRNSTQTAITATEAYYIMKFGAESGKQVPPWTNPAFVVIRNAGSSTQLSIGYAIGVPGSTWSSNLTNTNSGSGDVVTKVKAENTTGNAEQTLGILATTRYDQERADLKALAFEGFNQCLGAVFPDSTGTTFDKQNIRDGHFPIWTHTRYWARVDGSGQPSDAKAKNIIDILTEKKQVTGLNILSNVVKTGGIPRCAMKVQRPFDGAALEAYSAPEPCDCYFDQQATGATSCTACTTDGNCTGTQKCRRGLCEAR